MDPEVWKHLADHEDILRLILCRVSWDTNLRLRSVSKAFYSMLPKPSVSTWSSMFTDTSFRTDHPGVMWVNGDIDAEHLEQSNADTVCLLSTLIGREKEDTFESVTHALVNFELHRLCKLPTLGDLPFGTLKDFIVTGVAEGLLLLERFNLTHADCWVHDEGGRFYFSEPESDYSEVGIGHGKEVDIERFLFNPLTKGFIKLPVVPKIKGNSESGLVRMIMAVENEVVTVVALEFSAEMQSRLPRILIWRQGSEDWELFKAFDPPSTILPVDSTLFVEGTATNAVFVGGELFLRVETNGNLRVMAADGEKVFSFGSRACGIDPELIWSSNDVFYDRPHLFQHEGVLKCLELEVTIELYPGKVVGVLGDILCIRGHYNGFNYPDAQPDVFLLYNFLTKQWCRCYAKKLADYKHFYDMFFLWSPKRHDSRQITPSVR
ncbi:hypothetical protein R1sor_014633 [Riccia sorocarpa]|uniref:F-box domain-containing protein n=1 Tax=Riccia sorocarpa TaxID=122646 RepID=A0ABD3HG25_9MARC